MLSTLNAAACMLDLVPRHPARPEHTGSPAVRLHCASSDAPASSPLLRSRENRRRMVEYRQRRECDNDWGKSPLGVGALAFFLKYLKHISLILVI